MPSFSQKLITVLACLLALALHIAAANRFGLTPALGPLLSPFEGFWQNAEEVEHPNVPQMFPASGLKQEVIIRFDSSLVPHIQASNQADLFYAQGYICASMRLWQMDFITRAAAGRMGEIFGERALEYDRFQRRFGMGTAANAALDSMMADPTTRLALEAYTQGTNAYLAGMDPRQVPLEYKILGYQPEPWTPLKTAYLLKYMAYSLTGYTEEVAMTKAIAAFGFEKTDRLYPISQSEGVPVIPVGTPFSFPPLTTPAVDTTGLGHLATDLLRQADPRNGSNNWALSGSRTRSGKPLLANDPHLDLQLPSLWLRMELSAPGMEVSGLTLPGAPGIIIGHNKALAWGVTNAGADVLDLYKIDRPDPDHYRYQGKTYPFRKVVETIALSGSDVRLDTVFYTHLGPLAYTKSSSRADIPAGVAIAWVAHKPGNDLACFLGLAKARNPYQVERALSRMAAPAQNFAYADTAGNIGMYVAGRLPLRAPGQGRFVQSATSATAAPYRFIPFRQNPHVRNPAQGFVASANQRSADSSYPYYLDNRPAEPYRGNRIAERLSGMTAATPDSMAALQTDNLSGIARRFLPAMLAALPNNRLSMPEREVAQMVRSWNYRADSDQIAPTVFSLWFKALQDTLWDELRAKGLPNPMHAQLADALSGGSLAEFLDVQATPQREGADNLYRAAYHKAYWQLICTYGAAGKAWQWGRVKRTGLTHMAHIPGLSIPFISLSGGPNIVNAVENDHGPSVRMVVDLQPPVRAFGNMPGGQSGNPGSPYYLTGLEDWRLGKLTPWLNYGSNPKQPQRLMAIWKLRP